MSPAALLVAALLAAAASASAPPEVQPPAGPLRGKWTATLSGRPIAAFEGIPYAAPPVGPLRFQPPVAAAPWSEMRVADRPGSMCLQRNIFLKVAHLEGSEDCLFINVYAPETVSRAQPLPVLAWVHGGGFFAGVSHEYGPEFLLERDVILVTFNYRLGPLGFLSTGDGVIAGNFGMKDQVQALRWVRENIRAFGGDADKVTIFGESAGAGSVHHLTISPLAKGLFHGAIAMSGSALSPWAFRPPRVAAEFAAKVAVAVGCPMDSGSAALRECLMGKSAEDIINTDLALYEWGAHPMCPFTVTAEPAGPGAFLDRHPAAALAATPPSVPLVIGFVSHEGCVAAAPIITDPKLQKELDEKFVDIAPIIFHTKHLDKSINSAIFHKIRKFYFNDSAIDQTTKWDLTKMFSDHFFICSILESVKIQKQSSATSPVYLYDLAYLSKRSFAVAFGEKEAGSAMCHGDDLLLMFPLQSMLPGEQSAADKAIGKELIDAIVTFASTGAPTRDGSWRPVQNALQPEYVHLPEAGKSSMRSGYEPERVAFWRDLPVNLAFAASDPPTRDEL